MIVYKCRDCQQDQQSRYTWACSCGGAITAHEEEAQIIQGMFALIGMEHINGKPFLQFRDIHNDETFLVSPGSLKKIIKKRGPIPLGELCLKEYRGVHGDKRWNVVKGKK